jgi:hypothetical protein
VHRQIGIDYVSLDQNDELLCAYLTNSKQAPRTTLHSLRLCFDHPFFRDAILTPGLRQ